jgi:hypothetical protein
MCFKGSGWLKAALKAAAVVITIYFGDLFLYDNKISESC